MKIQFHEPNERDREEEKAKRMEIKQGGTVPSESPTWKREPSAHLLKDSASEVGTFQAFVLPPTKKSLASVEQRKTDMSSIEDIRALCKAMVDADIIQLLRERERERDE